MSVVIYREKCLDSKNALTSKTGSGTPNAYQGPACHSKRITISPKG